MKRNGNKSETMKNDLPFLMNKILSNSDFVQLLSETVRFVNQKTSSSSVKKSFPISIMLHRPNLTQSRVDLGKQFQ